MTLRHLLADMWLRLLFWNVKHFPRFVQAVKPLAIRGAWTLSPGVRRAIRANAPRLLERDSIDRSETRRFGYAVIGHFYDAVVAFGVRDDGAEQPNRAQVLSIQGEPQYLQARREGTGAILVTAHLGCFESAVAMLRTREPHVHVVFRRDPFPVFEKLRSAQRARLGVAEAAIDGGLDTWIRLRDALSADHVVLMQGDRVVGEQPGVTVPFCSGHIKVPSGPAKLSRLTGAPVIPVFATKDAQGQPCIQLCEPLWPDQIVAPSAGLGTIDPMILKITQTIEAVIKMHPQQWLCLHRAFIEDADGPSATRTIHQ